MALVDVSPFMYPAPRYAIGNINASYVLTATGQYVGFVACAHKALSILYCTARITNTVGSPTATFSIETVDATTGQPTGTLWNSGTTNDTIATSATLASGGINTQIGPFPHAASISAGQMFAAVIRYVSGTSISVARSGSSYNNRGLPYMVGSTGGVAITDSNEPPIMFLQPTSNTGQFIPGLPPYLVTAVVPTFNSTNSVAHGAKIQVPFKCRCVGVSFQMGSAVGDFNIVVLESDGTTEVNNSRTAFDGNQYLAVTTGHDSTNFFFDNPVTLLANTTYYVAVEAATATNCTLYYLTGGSVTGQLSAFPGQSTWIRSVRTSGTWADSNSGTDYPLIDICIDQVDDGTGAGAAGITGIIGE